MKTKWKSRERFRSRLTCLALASILAAGCIAAALGGTVRAADPLNLSEPCTLQVKVEPKAMTEEGEKKEAPEVVIDLYKVANAVKEEGYDAYHLEPIDAFAGLKVDLTVGEDTDPKIWKSLAQSAAAIIFPETGEGAVTVTDTATRVEGTDFVQASGLGAGLYLMVPRGTDLTVEEYLIRQEAETGGAQSIKTVAYSDSYTFTYEPQLVALPSKEAVDDTIATSNPGRWLYEMTAESKPEVSERYGTLRIDKELIEYLTGKPATFVFTVEATLRGRVVYSDVVALDFTAPGTQSQLIADKIPVGAFVTVTESYSGATYQGTQGSAAVQTLTMTNVAPEDPNFDNIASFQNTYDNTGRRGSAITNHFEYTDDGEGLVWNWTQIPAATPGGNE